VSLVLAVAALAVACVPATLGPVAFGAGSLRVSVSDAYKPLSVAAACLLLVALSSASLREAWRHRSPLVFYAAATAALWICAMGPTARFLGHRMLYKAPYAWLMGLPGFADEFRSPARFAMLAALTLSVAAALAFVALARNWAASRRHLALGLLSVGVLADGWVRPFPLVVPPPALQIPAAVPGDAVVLELPLGVEEDAAAMYHGTQHEHPVANGMSGYHPPHVAVLQSALRDNYLDVIDALAPEWPLAVFVNRAGAAPWIAQLPAQTSARAVEMTATHAVLVRPPVTTTAWVLPGAERQVTIAGIEASDNGAAIARATDGDPATIWTTTGVQQGGETIAVTLAEETTISELLLALDLSPGAFPRELAISASMDGERWVDVWRGPTARATMRAALADPRHARVSLPFAPVDARYVRVVQTARASEAGWAIAELALFR
jgi:hypothetical protein